MSLKKNDVIELEITGFSSEGSGVGHYEGYTMLCSDWSGSGNSSCYGR